MPEKDVFAQRKRGLEEKYFRNIAAASGGILGFGNKISDAEQTVIERIAAELETSHQDAARQMIQSC